MTIFIALVEGRLCVETKPGSLYVNLLFTQWEHGNSTSPNVLCENHRDLIGRIVNRRKGHLPLSLHTICLQAARKVAVCSRRGKCGFRARRSGAEHQNLAACAGRSNGCHLFYGFRKFISSLRAKAYPAQVDRKNTLKGSLFFVDWLLAEASQRTR